MTDAERMAHVFLDKSELVKYCNQNKIDYLK